MASRVNVKFVLILSAAVAMVFVGVAGALIYVKYRSGDRYVRLAEQALAAGDVVTADRFYARAVGKEPTNVAWMKAWRDVRTRVVPDTESRFRDDYTMYVAILRSLAITQRTNVEAHRDHLQSIFERAGRREAWEELIRETEAALRFFGTEPPPGLRRYRGIAIAALDSAGLEVERGHPALAVQDLEAAIKADPKDLIAADSLRLLHRTLASRAKAAGDAAGEQAHLDAARAVVAAMEGSAPSDPLTTVTRLMQEVADAERGAAAAKTVVEQARARSAAYQALKPRTAEVQAALMQADPAALTPGAIEAWYRLASVLAGRVEGLDLAIAVLDRALGAKPSDPDLLAQRAFFSTAKRDFEGAIAQGQKLADLPNPTISFAGWKLWHMRAAGVFTQANAAVTLVFQAPDPAARAAALARAKSFRQALALQVPATSPQLKFIDGKIKFAEGDTRGAQRLLTEFISAPGDAAGQVPQAVAFLVDVGTQTGELGLARENLLTLRKLSPGSPEILLPLAELDRRLQNWNAAAEYYQEILAADPDHADARRELEVVQSILGKENTRIDDPVTKRLADAQRAALGDKTALGNDQKAIQILEEGLEPSGHDLRLVSSIVQLRISSNDREGALRTIQAALAKHPEDANLKDLQARIEAASTLEGTLKWIDSGSIPDLDRWLLKRAAYEQSGKKDEAAKALAEAAKLAPTDARILQYQLEAAIAAEDLATAQKIADTAAQADADRADGDTFKAQVLYAQKNPREAAVLLQRAVDRGNAPAGVYRMLGQVQFELGRATEAIASLQKAHSLVPTDINVVKKLIEVLLRLDRANEALDVARAAADAGRHDAQFMNLWLTLEAAGGNTQVARDRREQLLAQNPDDRTNKAALAGIYMEQKAWDQARTLLDQLRAALPESTQVATLDARWYADRGDLEGALKVLKAHLGALQAKPEGAKPDPYVAVGQFMARYGQYGTALLYYRQAEKVQDPKTMSVSLLIGNTFFAEGQYTAAEEHYRKVLAAGVPDPDRGIRQRLIDCLNQLRRFADAEKEFAALGADADADPVLMCQHAQTARGLGDRARARQILDRAIAKFPQEPFPFLRRARLVMNEPAFVQDALDDLATALRHRPGLWQALQTRYTILLHQGKTDEAVRDLRAAVDANPSIDQLRFQLIDQLLALGRETEATDLANAAVKTRPGDLGLMRALGERFVRAGRLAGAARYYKLAFEQVGSEAGAVPYLGVLLTMDPPALDAAQAVLNAMPTSNSWSLLLFRAQVQRRRGGENEARADVADALALVETEAGIQAWYPRFRQVYPEPQAAAAVLASLRARGAALDEWMSYFRACLLLENPATQSEGLAALRAMLEPKYGKTLRTALCKTVFSFHLNAKPPRLDEAIRACQDGLAVEPGDAELSNNLAYLLSEHSNKPAEALPYSEAAVKAASDNYAIVDTLASIQRRLDQKDLAIQTLSRALTLTRTEADKATCAIKLARWKLEAGDRVGAAALADLVTEFMNDNPMAAQQSRAALDQLNKDLQSAPR